GDLAVGLGDDGGRAAIRLFADSDIQRQTAEQVDAVILAHGSSTAGAEDVFLMAAVGADVRAHVFDNAENGDADFLEHLQSLARIEQGDVLRGGDDDSAGDRYFHRHHPA